MVWARSRSTGLEEREQFGDSRSSRKERAQGEGAIVVMDTGVDSVPEMKRTGSDDVVWGT